MRLLRCETREREKEINEGKLYVGICVEDRFERCCRQHHFCPGIQCVFIRVRQTIIDPR